MSSHDPVEEFEQALAARIGQEHVVAVTYARLGLRLLLDALGLRAGDEVIVSGLTCRVVVLAIQAGGYRPVYADLASSGGLNVDETALTQRVTSRTRAIVFQRTFGTSAGVDGVASFARRHGIPLIEDCAQCLPPSEGARGAPVQGVASIWSHNFRKPMPLGAGGCVATSDAALSTSIRALRDRGPSRSAGGEVLWWLTRFGYSVLLRPATYWPLWSLNRRFRGDHREKSLQQAILDEVVTLPVRISSRQAEWGLRGLEHVERRIAHASEIASMYESQLRGRRVIRQVPGAAATPLYLYPVLARNKPALLDAARRSRKELVAWPLSTPIYPIERVAELEQCEYVVGSCPNAEECAKILVGLPLDLMTTKRMAQDLIDLLSQAEVERGN